MQDKFQNTSDQIIGRNILFIFVIRHVGKSVEQGAYGTSVKALFQLCHSILRAQYVMEFSGWGQVSD